MDRQKNETKVTPEDILDAAAKLIIERGRKEVSIKDLAEKAKVKRPTIHYVFRQDESTSSKTVKSASSKTVIYRRIVNEFLIGVQKQINSGLGGLPPAATPIERILSILFSTFAAFEEKPTFGKVVFQELNLGKEKQESKIVHELFQLVDQLIRDSKEKGEIAEGVIDLDDWKIRQVVFAASRGLLLTFYLKEGQPPGAMDFTKEEVIIEVLRIVQLYCSKDAKAKIENNIKAIRELAVKASLESSKAQ